MPNVFVCLCVEIWRKKRDISCMRQNTIIECVDIKWNHKRRIIAIAMLDLSAHSGSTHERYTRSKFNIAMREHRDATTTICLHCVIYILFITFESVLFASSMVATLFSFFFLLFCYLHQCLWMKLNVQRISTCTQYKPQSNQKWFIIFHIRFSFYLFLSNKTNTLNVLRFIDFSYKSLGYRRWKSVKLFSSFFFWKCLKDHVTWQSKKKNYFNFM